MPTVELDIRQLADEGGTAPIAPITVTDAVLDENGDTLTDILDTLNNGLLKYKDIDATTNSSGNLTTYAVGLSSTSVVIVGAVSREALASALILQPYIGTSLAYGIHVSDSSLSPVTDTALKLRVYYINR